MKIAASSEAAPNPRVQRTRHPLGGTIGSIAKRIAGLSVVSVIAALSCRKAQAVGDWRYTQWGTTEEQVVTASRSTAVPAASADQSADISRDAEVRLKAPVSWIGESFVAFFGFDRRSHQLSSVTLQLQSETDASVTKVRDTLRSLYGSPSNSMKQKDVELIVWFVGSDQISFMRLTDPAMAVGAPVTSVGYQPLSGQP